ncbi:MAG: DUF1295 domain-containing protein [Flavobacteriales bacterium]|nr:DUF1295 domain-containing protein [Flavobacteriales bacterium]MCB9168084.1 DUF1295 domain-containing protein [Flavobacteriales bacterium]
MRRTIVLLLVTLVVVPLVSYLMDAPLTDLQWSTLRTLMAIYLTFSALTFAVSQATGNCSQVDKLWSILPVLHVWVMADAAGYTPRALLMAGLVTLWGIRLTYNFGRRGGYSWRFWAGEEDHRWGVLRRDPNLSRPWAWTLFDLFFISFYQLGLVLLFTLPMLLVVGAPGNLGAGDILLATLFLAFLSIETIADQQQWEFQKEKHRRLTVGERLDGRYALGFVHDGLWSYVRHPNYAAEQVQWTIFYGFGVLATGRPMNWSLCGVLLLVLLFQGSSDFGERISTGKYAGYEEYRRRVPRFLPRVGDRTGLSG